MPNPGAPHRRQKRPCYIYRNMAKIVRNRPRRGVSYTWRPQFLRQQPGVHGFEVLKIYVAFADRILTSIRAITSSRNANGVVGYGLPLKNCYLELRSSVPVGMPRCITFSPTAKRFTEVGCFCDLCSLLRRSAPPTSSLSCRISLTASDRSGRSVRLRATACVGNFRMAEFVLVAAEALIS